MSAQVHRTSAALAERDFVTEAKAEVRAMRLERRLQFINALLRGSPTSAPRRKAERVNVGIDTAFFILWILWGGWVAAGMVGLVAAGPLLVVFAYVGVVRPIAAILRARCERALGLPAHRVAGSVCSLGILGVAMVFVVVLAATDRLSCSTGALVALGVAVTVAWFVALLVGRAGHEWSPGS